jgi:general stress protein 26
VPLTMQMATKEEIRRIVGEAKWAYLATSASDQPSVRPVSTLVDEDLVCWIGTHACTRKVGQVKANPRVEMCFCTPEGRAHVRFSGAMEIVEDKQKKEWFFSVREYMASYLSGPDDPDYVLLRLTPDKIEVMPAAKMEYEAYAP